MRQEEDIEGCQDGKEDADDAEDDDFVSARPTRFRPTGCFVRLDSGSEAWLPVEYMEPRTEAATAAIRERVRALPGGRVRVREISEGEVSMLTAEASVARATEIDVRRRMMEEGIAVLRESYDPKKWVSGPISAVQATGAYVSVVEGKDAFIPIAEIPEDRVMSGGGSKDNTINGGTRIDLHVGEVVQFRVVRHSWQTDSFSASMLSYEESVARYRANRGLPPANGPRSAPAAARSTSIGLLGARGPDAASSHDRSRSQDMTKHTERWAHKGFSVVESSTADELNAWLRTNTEERKAKSSGGKAGPKVSEKKYIVSVVRGMTSKVLGQITMPTRASEKEVKDAAVQLVSKSGELKAGQEHKGVTIAKNIITVKA